MAAQHGPPGDGIRVVPVAIGGAPAAVPDPLMLHRVFGDQDAIAFREPSREFRPETWFHFIGGNVSTQGITADLEAIAGAGIEGVQLFRGQFGGHGRGWNRRSSALARLPSDKHLQLC